MEATPLFVAANMGKYKVVKYLAEEAGADVQAKNRVSHPAVWQ